MKQYNTILMVLPILMLVSKVASQCLTENDARSTDTSKVKEDLYVGQQEFSLALLKEINKANVGKNVFFSPHSTYHALLMAYFIAKNQTEKSLKTTLRIPDASDKIDVLQAFKVEKYIRSMSLQAANDSYEFDLANRIYVSPKTGVRPCMQDYFTDEIEKLDFNENPANARLAINKWVENATKNQIQDFLPSDAIDENTNLVLVNAAYFKGLWASEFDPEKTQKSVFYISSNEKTLVDMMSQEGTFNYEASETLGAHVLELPYKGNDISMFIFLPPFSTNTGVENVLEKLNGTTFKQLVKSGMLPRKVFVSIPKFSIEQTIKLVPVLKNIGVGDLFDSTSDLSELTGQNNLKLGDALHKAKIELDEQGTVAAAATAFFTFRSSRPIEPASFICNHPFIYTIYSRSSDTIIFAGILRNPATI